MKRALTESLVLSPIIVGIAFALLGGFLSARYLGLN